jgi:kynurenine--oxoglutarate transaminase/cysteine-S-conjugate beta-lyase/glutamine--phenylpyruvate transaminase
MASASVAALANRRTLARSGGNIFAAATAMATQHKSVNLGQGFPAFPTPEFAVECVAQALREGHNQYTRPAGNPLLVDAIAQRYSPLLGRQLDPLSEVIVTSGAQEAIFNAFVTFLEEDDAVVTIDPSFDAYRKAAQMVGATAVGVPLRPVEGRPATSSKDLRLDVTELEAKLASSRSKILVLNTPHNPTGKMFSRGELEAIAAVVRRHPRLLVLSDEVYECHAFDGNKHTRFATLDGMWDRTVTLFSAGKTFSATGWRIGYCVGPARLMAPMGDTTGITSFCAPTPLQVGVARAFAAGDKNGYFTDLPRMMQLKRDKLCAALQAVGMNPIVPEGGYFVLADTSRLPVPKSAARRDVAANEWLTKTVGVTGIPTSAFYAPEHQPLSDHVLRFAVCKSDHEIAAAGERLRRALVK